MAEERKVSDLEGIENEIGASRVMFPKDEGDKVWNEALNKPPIPLV